MTSSDPLYSGDNRPPVYYDDDGTMIIRASSIGTSCLWELVAAGQGYPPGPLPDNIVRAFRTGHELEPIIIAQVKQERPDWRLLGAGQEEGHLLLVLEDGSLVKIRFHVDEKYAHGLDSVSILEVKSVSDDNYQQVVKGGKGAVGKLFDYDWQASVMMHATGLPLTWAAYNKGKPEKVIDGVPQSPLCPDKGSIHYDYCDVPPISLDEIRQKVAAIKSLVDGEDVVESGRPCDNPQHYPCRYLHLRPEPGEDGAEGGMGERATVVLGPEDQQAFNGLVARYVMYKGQADEADELRKQALKDIKAMVGEVKQTLVTDEWIVPMVQGMSHPVDWSQVSDEAKAEIEAAKGDKPYYYLRDIKRRD